MLMHLNDETGFTLLEALVALMMTSSILLLLVRGLNQVHTMKQKIITDAQSAENTNAMVFGDRQIEWHLFLNQLELYLEDSHDPKVAKSQIEVTELDKQTNRAQQVIYKRPDSGNRSVILQYKNNGKLRMLTDVETFAFFEEGGWLELDVTFRNGDRCTGRIWIESWAENSTATDEELF